MSEHIYDLFLQHLTTFGPVKTRQLLSAFDSKEALFKQSGDDLLKAGLSLNFTQIAQFEEWKDTKKLYKEMEELKEAGVRFISEEDPQYPSRLHILSDAPFGIFLKGSLPEENRPSVGIIGSRACTNYGREMAWFFGKELALRGLNIISGMALGIDGYAQKGAVSATSETSGRSFGVLAGGANICYPRENIGLYNDLCRNGHGIISEKPLNTHALPRDFPVRNRIIAALSDVLIVIEASEHSGSQITVNHALALGKDIFALPGRVGDRQSSGTNDLIKNGAFLLTSPEDVFQYFGMTVGKDTEKRNRVTLTKEEKTVYDMFQTDPLSTDDLLFKTQFPVSILQPLLLSLEIKGLIKKAPLGGFIRC